MTDSNFFVPISADSTFALSSQEERLHLVHNVSMFVVESSPEELNNSNVLTQLTLALNLSIKLNNGLDVEKIVTTMLQIATKDYDIFISLMSKNFDFGDFEGQNIAYVLLNTLYLASFDTSNYRAVIAISYLFSSMFKIPNQQFTETFLQTIPKGTEEGKNALLVMALTLLHITDDMQVSLYAETISQLVVQMLQHDQLTKALTEKLSSGIFAGKDTLHFLIRSLRKSASDMPLVASNICNVLAVVIAKNSRSQLKDDLFTPILTGSLRGLTSLQQILSSLISAAFDKKNEKTFIDLMLIIDTLLTAFPEEMQQALTTEIRFGENATKYGLFMLTQAYCAAVKHKLDPEPILTTLAKLIENTPNESLFKSFTHQPTMQYSQRKFDSPLMQLEKELMKNPHSELEKIILQIRSIVAISSVSELETELEPAITYKKPSSF